MALSPNGLANEIVNSIHSKITSKNINKIMSEIGHAIARYLTKNTSVKYTWSGIMPGSPPTPDSVTSYVTTNMVGDFTCSPTNVSDPIMHGVILGKQITDGIRKLKIFAASGWVVPPGGFLCAPSIVLPPCPQKNDYQYWLSQSKTILGFYKLWINPKPLTGAHGSYSAPPGAGAVMTKIY